MDDGREGMSLEVSLVEVTPGREDSSYREPQASMLRAATRLSVGEQETSKENQRQIMQLG